MNGADLRQLETADLEAKVTALEEELFTTRFQHATSQLQDSSKIGKVRKTLARAKTILHQRLAAAE